MSLSTKRVRSTKRRVLIVCEPKGRAALDAAFLPNNKAKYDSKVEWIVGDSPDVLRGVDRVDGLIFVPPVPPASLAAVWQALPNQGQDVEWIHSFFAGVDAPRAGLMDPKTRDLPHKDQKFLPASGAVTTNGRGAFSDSLAEWSIAVMLHFNKQIPRVQQNLLDKKWDKFVMHQLAGRSVGFLGWGSIAKTTAQAAHRAFGMKILAYRKTVAPNTEAYPVEMKTSPHELCGAVDFVINTLPGTPETYDFVDKSLFDAMRPGAVFVNVGRGSTVDEAALLDALTSGKLGGAGIDVFKEEPLPETSPLWKAPNLLLTAHNADNTEDYIGLGWRVAEGNLDAYLEGWPASMQANVTPFDLAQGY